MPNCTKLSIHETLSAACINYGLWQLINLCSDKHGNCRKISETISCNYFVKEELKFIIMCLNMKLDKIIACFYRWHLLDVTVLNDRSSFEILSIKMIIIYRTRTWRSFFELEKNYLILLIIFGLFIRIIFTLCILKCGNHLKLLSLSVLCWFHPRNVQQLSSSSVVALMVCITAASFMSNSIYNLIDTRNRMTQQPS